MKHTTALVAAALVLSAETIAVLAVAYRDATKYARWLAAQPPARMCPPVFPMPAVDLPDHPPADAFTPHAYLCLAADPALTEVSGGC